MLSLMKVKLIGLIIKSVVIVVAILEEQHTNTEVICLKDINVYANTISPFTVFIDMH